MQGDWVVEASALGCWARAPPAAQAGPASVLCGIHGVLWCFMAWADPATSRSPPGQAVCLRESRRGTVLPRHPFVPHVILRVILGEEGQGPAHFRWKVTPTGLLGCLVLECVKCAGPLWSPYFRGRK